MKKTQLVGLVLVAVCAFGALTAASAFGLTFTLAEWLDNAKTLTALTSAVIEGELLFENLLNLARLLCSGIFIGSVGPNGEDEVTELQSLGKVPIPVLDEELAKEGLKCTGLNNCEAADAEVWPVNLPWLTELMLDSEEPPLFFDLVIGNVVGGVTLFPGYLILCLFLGVDLMELCEVVAESFGEVSNGATDVETVGAVSPESTCLNVKNEGGNLEEGLLENNTENLALIFLLSGAALSVSN